MDKIIYTCSAEHIGFVFPKRKWWDFSKKPREARMEAVETFSGEKVVILMRILERADSAYYIYVPSIYREEIQREFIKRVVGKRRFEILLVIDFVGDTFADLIAGAAEDVNYLAVFTKKPEQYEFVLEQLAQETGLIGMIFTDFRDFKQYQRMICEGKKVLVFQGNRENEEKGSQKCIFFHFPKGSLVLDFGEQEVVQKLVRAKRIENDYVSLPIFLDNIIKNGYNSLVNEGLQTGMLQISHLQQNVYRTDEKNKLSEKRKGIKKWKKRRIF